MPKSITCKSKLMDLFNSVPGEYLAIHEIPGRFEAIFGEHIAASENAISSRLYELVRSGQLACYQASGEQYKRWGIGVNMQNNEPKQTNSATINPVPGKEGLNIDLNAEKAARDAGTQETPRIGENQLFEPKRVIRSGR